MPTPDIRESIKARLAAFGSKPLPEAARSLFASLGYESKRTLRISSVKQFCEAWDKDGNLTAKERASLNWLTALHFLFQLTDAEISLQRELGDDPESLQPTRIHSYLFLAAELPTGDWSRTDLIALARALNKPLPMPALVLFRHGETLSLAVIHRRLNKVAAERDVLEKATLIRHIQWAAPHRAHLDILGELAFDSLQAAHHVASFIQLHAAWRETLDIQELNKKFYQQLQHWYFWALGHARFLADAPKDAEGRDALSLIRLLTRLIFVWFIKEKGLVPANLFDARALPGLLKGFAPANAKAKDSVYYRAILQNLFFATLNCEPADRVWAKDGQNMMAHSLYRFRECFNSPASALDLFKDIPFLNGGLFECLDKDLGEGAKPRYLRIDGFSRRDDSQATVPDFLFFGPEQPADLSEFYEEKKSGRKSRPVQVRGLIEILHDFKFTIEENTSLEEDVALDPELLGRVFENLLAAYNPETQVTARKQTGSFYTPREIVDYMTGQALFHALREKLAGAPDLDTRLPSALAHDDAPNPFSPAETGRLIAAIDDLKILDPACGSGAFPMGVLHRLVHLLGKLDPGNARWKQRQLDKVREVPDPDVREQLRRDVEQAFAANELGYGRKLYLIENCLYGVDIQPIATQIAKLRFFISLIVEQRARDGDPDSIRNPKSEIYNRGVRPLPNLETRLVAADTLVPIEKDKAHQFDLLDQETRPLRRELAEVRHEHFNARSPQAKRKCRERDAELRGRLAALLRQNGLPAASATMLADWEPYDQNAHAGFFDNEWMFGKPQPERALIAEYSRGGTGFDIVIGNPPYIRIQTLKQSNPDAVEFYKENYASAAKGNYDIYVVFIEAGLRLLKSDGHLAYICPHKFFNAQYGEPIRQVIASGQHLLHVVHFGDEQVFPGATIYSCLLFLAQAGTADCRFIKAHNLETWKATGAGIEGRIAAAAISRSEWNFAVGKGAGLFDELNKGRTKLAEVADCFVGLQTSADDVFILQLVEERRNTLICFSKALQKEVEVERHLLHPIVSGTDIKSFAPLPSRQFIVCSGEWERNPRL